MLKQARAQSLTLAAMSRIRAGREKPSRTGCAAATETRKNRQTARNLTSLATRLIS
jgi:hypothetical protein